MDIYRVAVGLSVESWELLKPPIYFPPNGFKPPASSRSASANLSLIFKIRAHAILPQTSRRAGPKYRYKVMQGQMRDRIRQIIMQTCDKMGVRIVRVC